jgi:pyrroloquinoline quinone biosynthesis protein B
LTLRESQPFVLYATGAIMGVLESNPIFNVLNPEFVERARLILEQPVELDGGPTIVPFTVPGKVPLYLEGAAPKIGNESEDVIGLELRAGRDERAFFIPGCARFTPALAGRLRGAALVLFDGTLWTDDEMIRSETGVKTGGRMGHMSIFGPDGTLAAFARLDVRRRVLIHINNTNPILLDDSAERAAVEAAGWEVAYDGMEIEL